MCSSSTDNSKHVHLSKTILTSGNVTHVNRVDDFRGRFRGLFTDLRWEFPMLMSGWECWGCSWLHSGVPVGDGLVSGVWNGAALALLFLTGTQTTFGPHNLETNITHTES